MMTEYTDLSFDYQHFLTLAEAAMETDYMKELDKQGEYAYVEFSDMVESLQENREEQCSEYEYSFEEICEAVEGVVFADETQILPKPMADMVHFVYLEAIDRNDAVMTNDYGTLHYSGRIGQQDYEKAEKYYALAAKEGCEMATENLGYIYYYGRTGKVDYVKAYACFAKGMTVFNRPISAYKLGDFYKNGFFVDKEPRTAFSLYQKAEGLLEGAGPEKDMAAPDVYFRLGCCYMNAIGTDKDLHEALKYLQLAEQGFIHKIEKGDFFMKDLLQKTIELQDAVRKELISQLPSMDWAK